MINKGKDAVEKAVEAAAPAAALAIKVATPPKSIWKNPYILPSTDKPLTLHFEVGEAKQFMDGRTGKMLTYHSLRCTDTEPGARDSITLMAEKVLWPAGTVLTFVEQRPPTAAPSV